MKKAYEVTYKDGNEIRTTIVMGRTFIGALLTLPKYTSVYDNMVSLTEISYERYHILNIASAIREADTWDECEEECAELCRLAGMEFEWREADAETFETVLSEAAKRLDVEI